MQSAINVFTNIVLKHGITAISWKTAYSATLIACDFVKQKHCNSTEQLHLTKHLLLLLLLLMIIIITNNVIRYDVMN